MSETERGGGGGEITRAVENVNVLLRGTPKVRWKMKKHPFLKKIVDRCRTSEKHTLSTLFWTRVRSQSCCK